MKKSIALFLLCFSNIVFSQKFLNLDFEYNIPGTQTPQEWYIDYQGYNITLDDSEKTSLSKSLKMISSNRKENEPGLCRGQFPIDLVKGKNIEFTGKIKTKEISTGYAGLWWLVGGKNGIQQFDKMSDQGINGTNDWQSVSIKMKVNEDATFVNFGALLDGQGTAWFDDFQVLIEEDKFIDLIPRIPTNSELVWLKKHIYPIKSYDPDTAFDEDLRILKNLIGDSKVVALGETSHGSSEIYKMKHRIIKYLSENADFNIFSIEAPLPEAYKLNEYIINGTGNPTELIKGMNIWPWNTQEVLKMVEWMKNHNKSENKIYFTGFDSQYYRGSIQELFLAFKNQPEIQNKIVDLKTRLDEVEKERYTSNNSPQTALSQENKSKISNQLSSLSDFIFKSDFQVSEKKWLTQNIRLIEQFLDNSNIARDKYMAENVLWIKSQNPDSKIMMWAHNEHIKETGFSMGKYLSDSLKNDYLSIGFTFHNGRYTAIGDKGLTGYQAQESYEGSYEYFFNSIDVPIFILDLREAKKLNSEYSKWLLEPLLFRKAGAEKRNDEFAKTYLSDDFDFVIFIKESTSSTLL